MKKIKIISLFVFLVSAMSFTSCTKDKEDNLKKEIGTVVMTAGTITETSVVINTKVDYDGIVTMYLVKQVEETPNAGDLLEGNITGVLDKKSKVIKSGEELVIDFTSKIFEGTTYSVLSVLNRNDGNMSKSSQIDFASTDESGSILLTNSSTPSKGADSEVSPRMRLVFNEAIVISESALVNLFDGSTGAQYNAGADKMTVDGNVVTVDFTDQVFGYDHLMLVTIPEGSFNDLSGNASVEVAWDHDGTAFTRLDYYFFVRPETVNEEMSFFLGANTVQDLVDGSSNGDPYGFNVQLKEGTESTVLLSGYFGYHNNLEFTFDLVGGGISFDRFETGLFYDLTEGGVYAGTPEGDDQYRIFYEPSFISGAYCGLFDKASGQFLVSYDVLVPGLGSFGTVVHQFQKNTEPTMTYLAKKDNSSKMIDLNSLTLKMNN